MGSFCTNTIRNLDKYFIVFLPQINYFYSIESQLFRGTNTVLLKHLQKVLETKEESHPNIAFSKLLLIQAVAIYFSIPE